MNSENLQRLHQLVPPPALPACTGNCEDISRIANELAALGYHLPQEIAEVSMSYGRGSFVCSGFEISIHSIFQKHYLQLVDFNQRVYASAAVHHASEPTPWSCMFELGGYGYEDERREPGVLFLHTAGEESHWTVGVSSPLQIFSLGLVDFLLQLVQERISPQGFPLSFAGTKFFPDQRD